ncbi:MAG: GWxTD domain-containing protein [Marinilabiliales bacterium]|nr:GWxTD domain-containing protein [Marinilabiliales bacterium]
MFLHQILNAATGAELTRLRTRWALSERDHGNHHEYETHRRPSLSSCSSAACRARRLSPPGQKGQKPKLPESYKTWLDEEVVYIIAPMEREVFLKLQTDRERDLFIEAFWKQRDPNAGHAGERVQDRALPAHRLRRPLSRPRRAAARAGRPTAAASTSSWASRGTSRGSKASPRPTTPRSGSTRAMTDLGLPAGVQPRLLQGERPRRVQALQPGRRRAPGPAGGLFRRPGLHARPTRSSGRSSPDLAAVSLSLIPGEGGRRSTAGRRCRSDILIQRDRDRPRPGTSRPSTPRSSSSTRTSSRSNTRPTTSTATA